LRSERCRPASCHNTNSSNKPNNEEDSYQRIKAIIYSMASGGFRVGAWDYLKWGHVIPIERNGKIIAAKVIIYSGEDEE
jgi:hypothetical protein